LLLRIRQSFRIDDCWHAPTREADGRPKVDEEKFPRGMKVLVDEIHAMGLKAGIYSSAGEPFFLPSFLIREADKERHS